MEKYLNVVMIENKQYVSLDSFLTLLKSNQRETDKLHMHTKPAFGKGMFCLFLEILVSQLQTNHI